MLALAEAIKTGRLAEFIAQEEASGRVGNRNAFEATIRAAVKQPQSEDRTSRSPSRDDSTER